MTALKQVVIGLFVSKESARWQFHLPHPSFTVVLFHQDKYVEIVFNSSSDYKSSPIYISCDEGKKTKLYPEHEVAQFEIKKDCEASNEHLRIEKVLTEKLDTKVWSREVQSQEPCQ